MSGCINVDVFISRVLYFIKLTIFANKGTDDDETLEKCVTLYNKIKRIDIKSERDETDETFLRRIIKILNLSFKVDETGSPVCITDKAQQAVMIQLKPLDAIASQDLGEMKRFLKHTEVMLFYGIPLSFFLKKCKHIDVTWHYLIICYHLSQILVGETSQDPCAQDVINESSQALEDNLISLGGLKQAEIVNGLMSRDVYLKNTLLRVDNSEMIQESAEEVKRILTGRGINEDSMLYKLVDKIADKMENLDQDGSNIMTKLGSIMGELGLEMKGHFNDGDKDDIKSQLQSVMDIFKEVTSDPENMKKVPKEARGMLDKIIKSMPESPDDQMTPEKAKELQDLLGNDMGDITRNMAKESGANPEDIRRIEEMMQTSTPEQIDTVLRFKL